MSDPHVLRARILTVLGAATLLGVHGVAIGQDSGSSEEVACIDAPDDGICLSGAEVGAEIDEQRESECPIVEISEGTLEDARCCYTVTFACGDTGWSGTDCGCYGRPFVVEGEVIQAERSERGGWSADVQPDLMGLSADERAVLAERWTADGLAEHSSVAGFNRFALDLMAHGAPAELVTRAQIAAIQEIEHARLCFGLASAYAGRRIGPAGLPIQHAPVARDLVELAVWTTLEGAIGETLAAWLATVARDRAQDGAVRAVLDRIVEDESEHAQLAWATLNWAIEAGGVEVRDGIERAMRSWSGRIEGLNVGLEAHGLLRPEERAQALESGWNEIVRPAFDALLGPRGPRAVPDAPRGSGPAALQ